MKKLLGIVFLGLLWTNTSYAVTLPKDVASGSKFKKVLQEVIIKNMEWK